MLVDTAKRTILDVAGLGKTDEPFRREFIRVADRRGLDPSMLAAVISFESGFNPAAVNKQSGATGLIQFMPKTAALLGTTVEALRGMTALQQLPYVEKHYALVDPSRKVKTLEDHYLAVLSPACIGYPSSAVLPCRKGLAPWMRPAEGCPEPPTGAYCQNRRLDRDKDGVITTAEATSLVRDIYEKAKLKPPVEVDMTGEGYKPPPLIAPQFASGTAMLALGLGLAVGVLVTDLALRPKGRARALWGAAPLPFVPP